MEIKRRRRAIFSTCNQGPIPPQFRFHFSLTQPRAVVMHLSLFTVLQTPSLTPTNGPDDNLASRCVSDSIIQIWRLDPLKGSDFRRGWTQKPATFAFHLFQPHPLISIHLPSSSPLLLLSSSSLFDLSLPSFLFFYSLSPFYLFLFSIIPLFFTQ